MALTWKIGVVRQIRDYDAQGNIVDVMEIPVMFSDGSQLTEKIPVSRYTESTVNEIVSRRAQEHAAVTLLSGETE